MVSAMEWFVLLGCSALSLLATAVAVLGWQRGAPAEFEKRVDSLSENVERMYSEWAAARLNFEKLREELLDLAESVETKRRRVAARESRNRPDPAPDPSSPEYREHLLQQARAQGHHV